MTATPSSFASTLDPQTKTTYTIDLSHSTVQFKVRHLGFSKVTGRFSTFEGSVHVNPEQLGSMEANATIQTASITTSNEQRDQHLRSADFFDTESFPTLSFVSKAATVVSDERLTLTGDLTIRDTTRQVELDVEYLGQARDPWGGERVAFEARTKINRTDFGLTWNTVLETGGLLVSEEVEIVLEIQAVKSDA